LGEALEPMEDPEAERLDHGVHQVRYPPPLERGDARLERLETFPEVRDHDHPRRRAGEVPRHVEIGPVDRQHELGAGRHGGADLARVEGVDAPTHPRVDQLPYRVREPRELASWSAADVDDYVVA